MSKGGRDFQLTKWSRSYGSSHPNTGMPYDLTTVDPSYSNTQDLAISGIGTAWQLNQFFPKTETSPGFFTWYEEFWQIVGVRPGNAGVPPGCPTTQNNSAPSPPSPRLPNKPTKIKPMKDCCDLTREIHKHLGIKKLKKNKFPVAKAFLVAGGEGNEECEDYYQITQQLFRMLANGLILNPKSAPLGNEWQSVNATAWAGNMYEMMAETMSDGNSSQKYEIASIMQLTQLLTILAETSRKVEYLIDRLGGGDPVIEVEEIPAVFTVYEGHKGFEKKAPKKIDITKAKTDDDVEALLSRMIAPSKIPIEKWIFNPNHISILEAIRGESA